MQKLYAKKKYFLIFTLPCLLAYFISFIIPFVMGLYLSFTKFKTIRGAQFVGLSNYKFVFRDFKGFLQALVFTSKVSIVAVILVNVIAFALALILSKQFRGTNLFRTLFFMPNLIGGIILGYIWQLLLNGILIRLYGVDITYDARFGYWGIIILYSWQKIGYLMIIYIAGIQAISGDILEASAIDGASSWQQLWRIIIPNVGGSITVCLFLSLTDTFKMYDQNLALTGGAPANQTKMLAMDIYDTYYNRVGFAGIGQAKAVVFTVLVFALGMLQLFITRKFEVKS